MKIIVEKNNCQDLEHIPYIGEDIFSPKEYCQLYIEFHGIDNFNKARNQIWMLFFKHGISNLEIDKVLNNDPI
jgi:hypothetical protein